MRRGRISRVRRPDCQCPVSAGYRLGAARWRALADAQRARLTVGRDDTLTPTERRIAELVAAGHSNPEIAATLYISVKTVEPNLTRIYRKRGLRRRIDLTRHPLD